MSEVEVLIPHSVEERFPGRVGSTAPEVRVVPVEEDGAARGASSPRVLLRGEMKQEAMRRVLSQFPSIEWLHVFSAGVEHLLPDLQGYDGVVTNSAGVHAEPIAEWVIAMLLAHTKKLPRLFEHYRQREWTSEQSEELGERTLGIVGAGGIGAAIARRASGMDMRVVGLRASGKPTEHVTEMYRPDQLHEMLGICDYVVVAAPLTPQTTGLIGVPELRAMRPSGVILNIARGKIIDTEALVRALTEGWIAGAYLDVTDPEPLPGDHQLWTAPGAVITAHTSGNSPRSSERVISFFCDNLRRWVRGEPLQNVVDLQRGY